MYAQRNNEAKQWRIFGKIHDLQITNLMRDKWQKAIPEKREEKNNTHKLTFKLIGNKNKFILNSFVSHCQIGRELVLMMRRLSLFSSTNMFSFAIFFFSLSQVLCLICKKGKEEIWTENKNANRMFLGRYFFSSLFLSFRSSSIRTKKICKY